jgi:hypothetical protein
MTDQERGCQRAVVEERNDGGPRRSGATNAARQGDVVDDEVVGDDGHFGSVRWEPQQGDGASARD